MIEAFGVKNLRCLTDTGLVDLKPITLLVGRNSSGKSTFLRALPLLRQSVENPRRSPILWSHRTFVDFASLETAVNERSPDAGVTFSFRAKMSGHPFAGEPRCELSMTLATAESGVYVRACEVDIEGTQIRMTFGEDRRVTSLTIEGENMLGEEGLWLSGPATLIPSIATTANAKGGYGTFIGEEAIPAVIPVPFWRPLVAELSARFPSLSEEALSEVALARARVGAPEEMKRLARDIRGPLSAGAVSYDPASDTFRKLVFLMRVPTILESFDWVASSFAFGVRYLGPQRSVGERQYMLSEITVDEVLPRGENLPQFLARLDESQMASLADFTREHLGFETSLRRQGLYIEILIKQVGAAQPQNIADVGFGYAEVLPLCVSLWSSLLRDNGKWPTSVLALEQPELHLHPAHQARLARLFVHALQQSRKEGRSTCLMIETHSEALINSMGFLVREKQIDANDIQILFFDQEPDTRETVIQVAGYTATGALKNWPFGFLAPIANRLEDIARAAAAE